MKKFFALLLVAVMTMAMATAAFAADVTSFPFSQAESGDNYLVISTDTLSALPEGTTLTITVVRATDNGDAGYAWCVNNDANGKNWWENSKSDNGLADLAVGGTTTITVAVSTLIEYAATGNGVVLNCWNGVIPTAVAAAGPTGDATPVAAMAVIAMVSCAAVVVLRKKEA